MMTTFMIWLALAQQHVHHATQVHYALHAPLLAVVPPIFLTVVTLTKNLLRYTALISSGAGTQDITATGGPSPDLVTDTATVLGSPINRLARSGLDGIGAIAAGTMTQAQSRSLFMADDTVNAGNNVPKAKTSLQYRDLPNGSVIGIDANVDGSGRPKLTITATAPNAGSVTAYVDIQIRYSMWI